VRNAGAYEERVNDISGKNGRMAEREECMRRFLVQTVGCCLMSCLTISLAWGDEAPEPAKAARREARVLVLTGNEYPGHPWKESAPLIAKFLAGDRRLTAVVNQDPAFLASPRLHDFDVIVLNYMNWESPDPGKEARANLKRFVENGKGLVLVHFACGAFQAWPEFADLAGRVWDPKLRGHDPHGPFTVEITGVGRAVTRGMKSFETVDELYTCLRGEKKIEIVAKARSKVDGKDYPIAFLNDYGKGRVFHCVLGHDVKALTPEPVQELYRRGTAWAAHLPPVSDAP
jgi:type 1 glutamine amidotransferase